MSCRKVFLTGVARTNAKLCSVKLASSCCVNTCRRNYTHISRISTRRFFFFFSAGVKSTCCTFWWQRLEGKFCADSQWHHCKRKDGGAVFISLFTIWSPTSFPDDASKRFHLHMLLFVFRTQCNEMKLPRFSVARSTIQSRGRVFLSHCAGRPMN